MPSDASWNILHAVRLLLEGAPAADATDAVIEKWGRYVIKLLNGLKARQPQFLSLPEVVSVISLLQDLADGRLRVAWLAWGGDWLPGTVIEQCLSQLPAAAPSSVSLAALNLRPEEELDATCGVKRIRKTPKVFSPCEPPTKRARYTTSVSPLRPTKSWSLADKVGKHSLSETRKVLHECELCESKKRLCLTVTRKGVIQNRCAECISRHRKCDWKKGHLDANLAYRQDPSSFYTLLDPAGGATPSTTSVSVPTLTPAYPRSVFDTPDHPVTAVIHPPHGQKSATNPQLPGLHTRASLSPPTSPLSNPPVSATSLSLAFPLANDSAILNSEMTVRTGDAQPAKDEETLKVSPRPSFASLVVEAAGTDIADKARSMRYKAILDALSVQCQRSRQK
ncbi:hypothetical protein K503DRAFT_776767 [Rhizopogon vinicolor AM-OR11-026]|uniref:Zn(2)-C6 fungal-type domain-containing protein n=1 Tax=Rhizopogon vinicolor AM-OR11-026 TaxID=1314800 RepID=A0A1B7MID7_9AGAM|nr:hypothetical protein K503DRAFT_776767 [Rhizopogon vinicolor AM-OR11-026]